MTKRTSYERLRAEGRKDFDLMYEEVVTPYDGIKIAGVKK